MARAEHPLLPGQDLVEQGLADLDAGHESVPALLVSIGAPRLRALGFQISAPLEMPERDCSKVT